MHLALNISSYVFFYFFLYFTYCSPSAKLKKTKIKENRFLMFGERPTSVFVQAEGSWENIQHSHFLCSVLKHETDYKVGTILESGKSVIIFGGVVFYICLFNILSQPDCDYRRSWMLLQSFSPVLLKVPHDPSSVLFTLAPHDVYSSI